MAGLFGIGGGLIIVPVLALTFEAQGMSPEILVHVAVATSLAVNIITALSSIRTHHLKGAVLWEAFWPIAAGTCVGALVGVNVATRLSGESLQFLLGLFLMLVSVQMFRKLVPKAGRQLAGKPVLTLAGTGIGWVSSMFGIGGGTMTIPLLTYGNVVMQKAVGTAAACGLPIAVMGALTNIYRGWDHPLLQEWSFGFVYLPAFVGIILTSALFAHLGARLAHRLSAVGLRRIFAVFLFVVGLRFLLA